MNKTALKELGMYGVIGFLLLGIMTLLVAAPVPAHAQNSPIPWIDCSKRMDLCQYYLPYFSPFNQCIVPQLNYVPNYFQYYYFLGNPANYYPCYNFYAGYNNYYQYGNNPQTFIPYGYFPANPYYNPYLQTLPARQLGLINVYVQPLATGGLQAFTAINAFAVQQGGSISIPIVLTNYSPITLVLDDQHITRYAHYGNIDSSAIHGNTYVILPGHSVTVNFSYTAPQNLTYDMFSDQAQITFTPYPANQ